MKRIIVTGGRDYNNRQKVKEVLDFINPDVVIQGGASGLDSLAKAWANAREKASFTEEADWDKYGKAAGPIRNRTMLELFPDAIVVAFPGGKGTADCIKAALERKMLVLEVRE